MKKTVIGIVSIFAIILIIGLTLNAKRISQEKKQQQKIENETPVVLNTNLAPSMLGRLEGWFGELLQEKLDYQVEFQLYRGLFEEREKNTDVYLFMGELDYYDAVKKGELKNLEEDVKKSSDIYGKYTNALNEIRDDTYKQTGKKGIYGIPIWLQSFDDVGRKRYCVSIPSDAKHPKEAMDLISYSASEEGIMNIAFGPEGQMWKKENDKYVLIQDWYEMNEEHPGEKFVETKNGKETFATAVCKMELVGNESLGRELIK